MNTDEITSCLQGHALTKECFRGVFPADCFPDKLRPLPGACVVNSHPQSGPGQHWLAFYQTQDNSVDFFDSFGRPLSFYNFETDKHVVQQNCQIQSDWSDNCGKFCMFFIFMRSSGYSYASVIDMFKENHEANEEMIEDFCIKTFDQ